MDHLWERIRKGRHTAVLGSLPSEPPAALGLCVVQVGCDVPQRTLGAVQIAQRKVEDLLGGAPPLLDQAAERVFAGLRRRLLGDLPDNGASSLVVEAWNRLLRHTERPCVLIFDHVDSADEASLQLLREIVERPGWLRVPLLLEFRSSELSGGAQALLQALERVEGEGAVVQGEGPPRHQPDLLRRLPPEVLLVLRAGALMGPGFEVDLLATLLGVGSMQVLQVLQQASDAGVPLEDRGEGRFLLPEALVRELRAGLLPSLALLWHRRLASLLSEVVKPPAPGPDKNPPVPEVRVAEAAPPQAPRPAIRVPPEEADPPRADPPRADAHAAQRESRSTPTPFPIHQMGHAAIRRPDPQRGGTGNDARAATHFVAAGDSEAGAERFLAAARQAAAMGAHTQALAYANKALSLVEGLPASPRRRLLRVHLLAELGRLKWRAAGPGAGLTLAGALESLHAARALLLEDDPVDVRANLSSLIAGVCYDMGDLKALEQALSELTNASRILQAAGDAYGAARLLNDQAAVYVRLGDPVRASHLLEESRKVFESRAQTDPVAMVELAETDHLFARLPLHVAARPGREADAIELGREHARAAESAYRKLGATRDLARVWETLGRLELLAGRLERAVGHLSAAAEAQQSIGDVIGLARSTAALAEVLGHSGQHREALALLGESVTLNLEKGSPLGLAYNRRSLDQLAAAAPINTEINAEMCVALGELDRRLTEAELILGRVKLPGES